MKKIFALLYVLILASSLLSCNEKLKLAAPYKDITVVYGLLNMADTAHYIRVQKAFMDEEKSAIDMAQIADSSFYQSLSVVLKEINAGSVINTIPLYRVDLTNEGYPKETGAFFNTPSYAFKFKHSLNPLYTYRVVITNTITGNIDSASTPIINNTLNNSSFGITEWLRFNEFISFSRILTPNGNPDIIEYGMAIPTNVGAAEVMIRFNWTDSNIATGTATYHSADFNGFTLSNIDINKSGQTVSAITQNKNLYDFLSSAMGTPATSTHYRYLDSCDTYLFAAGTEYRRYKDLNSDKGGLSADEIKPLYTNVKGKDVMGLFSTRGYKVKMQIPISEATQDSLKTNTITRGLNLRFYN